MSIATSSSHLCLPASHYSMDKLATIYNAARVDYIVPMPMNGRRMADYIRCYDIDLGASLVSLDSEGRETGIIMLGVRGGRTWITRLGIIPTTRRSGVGQFLMEQVLARSRALQATSVQLEVIEGNRPAHALFVKLGFQKVRDLLVIRRPPGQPLPVFAPTNAQLFMTDSDEIPSLLSRRDHTPAWTEEKRSILNAGSVQGLGILLDGTEAGWIIYQHLPFQMSHLVMSPNASEAMHQALLYHLHKQHPLQETKVENLPLDHPTWAAFQAFGYVEEFRRIGMHLVF
ncbi:MAG TPA: GNAT family N-acetyltransferase [Aggregatilineales bacterium]|nr:GNAT family N-acetyltransferase [Anaerolineales bacterium]HRE49359.1 GNAT family N-acetyltransferase [Aggregatilineales bacterium]